jgi:hypothetical protein
MPDNLIMTGFLLLISITGCVTVAGLVNTLKELLMETGHFPAWMFSHEGSTVFSGANQMLVRSGNREKS